MAVIFFFLTDRQTHSFSLLNPTPIRTLSEVRRLHRSADDNVQLMSSEWEFLKMKKKIINKIISTITIITDNCFVNSQKKRSIIDKTKIKIILESALMINEEFFILVFIFFSSRLRYKYNWCVFYDNSTMLSLWIAMLISLSAGTKKI